MSEHSPRLDFEAMGAILVPPEEVALNYLQDECTKVFTPSVAEDLARLDTKYRWRMFEAMAQTYRVNDVFRAVTNQGYDWYRLTAPVESIVMTAIRAPINKVIWSDVVQRSPGRFADYMSTYWAQYPGEHDDPEDLKEFQLRPVAPESQVLMAREHKGGLHMLDGSHRLISLVNMGRTAIDLYAARRNDKPEISRQGDSTFNTLKRLFKEHKDPVDREAVMRVAALLMAQSTDGGEAVGHYWVGDGYFPDLQEAGRQLIAQASIHETHEKTAK